MDLHFFFLNILYYNYYASTHFRDLLLFNDFVYVHVSVRLKL